jgi:hypothetical protein
MCAVDDIGRYSVRPSITAIIMASVSDMGMKSEELKVKNEEMKE